MKNINPSSIDTSATEPTVNAEAATQLPALVPRFPSPRRNSGKIGRLPKTTREHINKMIDDGHPYSAVVEWLTQNGISHISQRNLSDWKDSGYIDWLNSQAAFQDMDALREFANDATANPDDLRIQEAALLLGTMRILRHLRDSAPEPFQKQLNEKPYHFVPLLHCLVGTNAQHLKLRKYKEDQREKAKASRPCRKRKRGVSKSTRQRIEEDLNLC